MKNLRITFHRCFVELTAVGHHGGSPRGALALAALILILSGMPVRADDAKEGKENGLQSPTEVRLPAGWKAHRDPGFVVHHPDDWTVRSQGDKGDILVRGPNSEKLIVWPLFANQALAPKSAGQLLAKLETQLWPSARAGAVETFGERAVRLRAATDTQSAVFVLTWVNSPRGSAGFLYVASAPRALFAATEDKFAAIMRSFRCTGDSQTKEPSAPAARPNLRFVSWKDPQESAFDVEVPENWTIQGGVNRFASVDLRPSVSATSPDRAVRVFIGDAAIPSHTVPNSMLDFAGFTEGNWYSPGYGVKLLVRRYATGTEFAKSYATTHLARNCTDVNFREARDLPAMSKAINQLLAQYAGMGVQMSLSTGEVAFTCRRDGKLMHGYCLAGTLLTQHGTGGLWTVMYLAGFLAPADQAPTADAALDNLLRTFRFNPQWMGMQQQITADTSRIVTRTNEEISRIISDAYWHRQSTLDRIHDRGSRARREVDLVYDPVTGRQIEVSSGSSYHWIDHRGNIVGTNTHSLPDLDYRELIHLD